MTSHSTMLPCSIRAAKTTGQRRPLIPEPSRIFVGANPLGCFARYRHTAFRSSVNFCSAAATFFSAAQRGRFLPVLIRRLHGYSPVPTALIASAAFTDVRDPQSAVTDAAA